MALQRAKPSDIPTNAVRLSKADAIDYQFKLMYEWKNGKDTFFFKYGSSLLGGASAAVGIYLNDYYRSKLKLRSYGNVSSFLAIAVIPCGLSLLFHHQVVVPRVVLQDTCGVCIEMRAAALQATFGCILPTILAPISGFSTALNYGTYNVPYITEPKRAFQLWLKLTKPLGNVLFGLFLAQALIASGVTILESRDLDKVKRKLELLYMEDAHS